MDKNHNINERQIKSNKITHNFNFKTYRGKYGALLCRIYLSHLQNSKF